MLISGFAVLHAFHGMMISASAFAETSSPPTNHDNLSIFPFAQQSPEEEATMTALFFGNTQFELGALIITPRAMNFKGKPYNGFKVGRRWDEW
jgi:hypothetical protein